MSNAHPFRISIIDYLNAAPLNYGFKHGLGFEHFYLKFQVPSICSDHLRGGEVDAGLISSIEYLRIPNLKIVPGLCIASPKRVRSVVLLSKTPPESIQTLALDTSSRTSVVLVQILLRERYGTQPQTTEMPPDIEVMLAEHDAALMIGDSAMRVKREGLMVLDLAEEWHAWTGLPFVFALWAIRPDAPELDLPGGIAPFFHQSFDLGKKNIETIIDEAWRTIGWTKQELRDYLTKNLSHTLGEMERESLSLFYEKAVRMGFAPENNPLRFL
ncbi:MAG: menaquinone biosynthesis protein [Holophagales bacterium]|jgi:chorismate dehydratase|nr:menaquinone biosynthesis protein [Holophagales bacterium]